MDRDFLIVLGLMVLAFIFVLPSWTKITPTLVVNSAQLQNQTLTFSLTYSVPEPKSCYLVVYGPFAYDGIGHETGNNIYVLPKTKGVLNDQLTIQDGKSLSKFYVELWCDNTNETSTGVPL